MAWINFYFNKVHEHSYRGKICILGKYYICYGATKPKNKWWWHLYFSRNATPWAATIYFGTSKRDRLAAKLRRKGLGLLFDPHKNVDAAMWYTEYAGKYLNNL